jgi:hypothetical protein
MKRIMSIERALRWAYVDELPKIEGRTSALAGPAGPASPSSRDLEMGRRGAEVDGGVNRYGVSPFDVWMGDVHPDAIVIGDTVEALGQRVEDWSDCLEIIADLGADDLMRQALARAAAQCRIIGLADLLRREALLPMLCPPPGSSAEPSWQSDMPDRRLVTTTNGRRRWYMRKPVTVSYSDGTSGVEWTEVEVTGRHGAHGPPPGAYCRWRLDPDPADVLTARIRHTVWVLTISALAEALMGALSEIEVTMSSHLAYPWLEGRSKPAPVLEVAGWPTPSGVASKNGATSLPRKSRRTA